MKKKRRTELKERKQLWANRQKPDHIMTGRAELQNRRKARKPINTKYEPPKITHGHETGRGGREYYDRRKREKKENHNTWDAVLKKTR